MSNDPIPMTAVERAYRASVVAISRARELQGNILKALDDERCPPHFTGIWNVHLKPEFIASVALSIEKTIRTQSECERDLELKLDLIETFLTSNLTTVGDAEERVAASFRTQNG